MYQETFVKKNMRKEREKNEKRHYVLIKDFKTSSVVIYYILYYKNILPLLSTSFQYRRSIKTSYYRLL